MSDTYGQGTPVQCPGKDCGRITFTFEQEYTCECGRRLRRIEQPKTIEEDAKATA